MRNRNLQRPLFWRRFIALVLFVEYFAAVNGLYAAKSPVLQLNLKNFNREVIENPHAVLVEFYAPWCGHCQKLAPEYEKVAETLHGLVKVAALDCDAEENKSICAKYGVSGFPTVKVFYPTSPSDTTKNVVDYSGARTAASISQFALQYIPEHFVHLIVSESDVISDANTLHLDDLLNTPLPKVILFTSKPITPPLFKALAAEWHHQFAFAKVPHSQTEISQKFGITELPRVVFVPSNDIQTFEVYQGTVNFDNLNAFLKSKAINAGQSHRDMDSDQHQDTPPHKDTHDNVVVEKEKEEAPQVTQKRIVRVVKTQEDLESACTLPSPKRTWCVVAFLSSSADNELTAIGRKQLHSLEHLSAHLRKEGRSFDIVGLTSPAHHHSFVSSMGVPQDVSVTLVMLHPRHRHYITCDLPMEAWNDDTIVDFIDGAMLGERTKLKFQQPPVLSPASMAEPIVEGTSDEPDSVIKKKKHALKEGKEAKPHIPKKEPKNDRVPAEEEKDTANHQVPVNPIDDNIEIPAVTPEMVKTKPEKKGKEEVKRRPCFLHGHKCLEKDGRNCLDKLKEKMVAKHDMIDTQQWHHLLVKRTHSGQDEVYHDMV